LYGKTGFAALAASGCFCGGLAPAPPASIKEQKQERIFQGREALSMGTWNSGQSAATEHMPRKPVDKSRSLHTDPQGCRSKERQPCHTASGESSRGEHLWKRATSSQVGPK